MARRFPNDPLPRHRDHRPYYPRTIETGLGRVFDNDFRTEHDDVTEHVNPRRHAPRNSNPYYNHPNIPPLGSATDHEGRFPDEHEDLSLYGARLSVPRHQQPAFNNNHIARRRHVRNPVPPLNFHGQGSVDHGNDMRPENSRGGRGGLDERRARLPSSPQQFCDRRGFGCDVGMLSRYRSGFDDEVSGRQSARNISDRPRFSENASFSHDNHVYETLRDQRMSCPHCDGTGILREGQRARDEEDDWSSPEETVVDADEWETRGIRDRDGGGRLRRGL